MAQATGTTIREDTISAPTVLDAIETVMAVNTVKMKLMVFTGIPASLAEFSSKVIKNNSL